jgi:hypothetical protein
MGFAGDGADERPADALDSVLGRITVSGLTKTYERIVGRQLARTHALERSISTWSRTSSSRSSGPLVAARAR